MTAVGHSSRNQRLGKKPRSNFAGGIWVSFLKSSKRLARLLAVVSLFPRGHVWRSNFSGEHSSLVSKDRYQASPPLQRFSKPRKSDPLITLPQRNHPLHHTARRSILGSLDLGTIPLRRRGRRKKERIIRGR